MSIWDHMKPAAKVPEPTDIKLTPDRKLQISWSDGKVADIPVRLLRQMCPCAACVDEWTRERTLKPETVPMDIGLREVAPVGNYALQLTFSDSHATGIYAWPLLRELSEQSLKA